MSKKNVFDRCVDFWNPFGANSYVFYKTRMKTIDFHDQTNIIMHAAAAEQLIFHESWAPPAPLWALLVSPEPLRCLSELSWALPGRILGPPMGPSWASLGFPRPSWASLGSPELNLI